MITKHPASRTLIVNPVGDFNALQAEHYRLQLRSLIDEGYHFLIFNLETTTYINSSGLGLFAELYNKLTRLEGSLKLIHCNPHAIRLLRQTRLADLLLDSNPEPGRQPKEAPFDSLHAMMSDEILVTTQICKVLEQLLSLDDPGAVAPAMLAGALQVMQAEHGALFLLDPDERRLSLAHWQGRDELDTPPRPGEISLTAGTIESQLLDRNEVILHELDDRDREAGNIFDRAGFATALAAPIRGRQRKLGLLLIEVGGDAGRVMQIAKPLIHTMTHLCGLALEKMALIAQLRQRNEELSGERAEPHDYHQSLAEAGKLAARGVVISGLSHLINNKMAPLLGYTQMLARNKDVSTWVSEKVARIHESGNEMSLIAAKLIRVSHMRDRVSQPVDHGELIRTAIDLLHEPITRNRIAVQVQLTKDPATLWADPDLVLQALLAILHRACTSFTDEDGEHWVQVTASVCGRSLSILIEDNGSGLDQYDREDWLDPLVPDEAMAQGRLFNYTIPRSIIRRQGGTLQIEDRLEGGKRVVISLPLGAEGDVQAPRASAHASILANN